MDKLSQGSGFSGKITFADQYIVQQVVAYVIRSLAHESPSFDSEESRKYYYVDNDCCIAVLFVLVFRHQQKYNQNRWVVHPRSRPLEYITIVL